MQNPKGMHSHSKNHRFPTVKAVYCFNTLSMVNLPKPHFQVQAREISGPYKTFNSFLFMGQWIRVFFGPNIQLLEVYAKVQTSLLLPNQHNSVTPWALARANSTHFQHLPDMGSHFLHHRRWDSLKPLFKGFIINNFDLMLPQASTSQFSRFQQEDVMVSVSRA